MPRVVIDNREVNVAAGSTLLDAARRLGLDVPALCWRDGCAPNTSCMVCLMKVKDPDRLAPSCATLAEEGMRVENETEEVRQARRA
ncbi:MAG: 2Fe-2S iron-sulfur cluster-binding protein, partial [Phycisphaerae bacterium]